MKYRESKNREKKYDEYRRLGMTEEQIEVIRKVEDEIEKSDREFYGHTVLMCDLENSKKEPYYTEE